MGASSSRQSLSSNVFEKELRGINDIVNKIINHDNTFTNKEYNFLSQDVCNKYQVILESDLSKHLKIHLAEFKSNIYVIPKEDQHKGKINKAQICEKISNHYISILYIICLIKYVYNLENNGDRSFGGVVFRNIKIVDNMMEIMYCDVDQKDTTNAKNPYRINLSKLDGFKFFIQYFLTGQESKGFMKLMRAILAKKNKSSVRNAICECLKNKTMDASEVDLLSLLYQRNYGEQLECHRGVAAEAADGSPIASVEREGDREVDTSVTISKHNPVFLRNFCSAIDHRLVDLSTKEGQQARVQYDILLKNYRGNVAEVYDILNRLVKRHASGEYTLHDIDSVTLTKVITHTKQTVRKFFFQSILDYQHLLNIVKNIPNVKLSIKHNGFE
jgi:hypothetical protein